MDFDANIEQLQLAYWNILLTAGPVLGIALAVGLFVGIIQAATSINEATLSFVPKLAIVLITMGLASGFMMTNLTDYFTHVFDMVASVR
ncbi:Flagellar biosynthetic protein FliQ [Thalassovita gelatinovora]|uniref:Flagellar biosynthetic protein FliQ n=1 Tax=Thalassovita gelatinovora TaxID=53501 RepID=A0A0P1FKC5_THAGE|nr:flagellar biosynthesis protein FliQ [Thalassovita gelatinovora]QIZ82399.1 flagellar biosynthesis protein FliQ [Thalassovita gelatinovora]CUH68480.1 Flagellar biosynthetic protein FliQ [Thalassovita gelatinovora]SEQ53133.1 flagellar biosynthetic protein FliQ [Thalassovita gelatinovora]